MFRIFINHFNILELLKFKRNSYNRPNFSYFYYCFSFLGWFAIIPLKILEIFHFFDGLYFVKNLIFKSRKLNKFEIIELQKVFENCINYDKIRIRENSFLAKLGAKYVNKSDLGYVLFNTISFSKSIDCKKNARDMNWLVHEVVHVLQFNHLGINYIFEALRAQRNGGYLFGGVEQLNKSVKLNEFNLEQQAEIATLYYTTLVGESSGLEVFSSYLMQLKKGEF